MNLSDKAVWNPGTGLKEIPHDDVQNGDVIRIVTTLPGRTMATQMALRSVNYNDRSESLQMVGTDGEPYFVTESGQTKLYLVERPLKEPKKVGTVVVGQMLNHQRQFWVRITEETAEPWMNNDGCPYSYDEIVRKCGGVEPKVISEGVYIP